MRTQVVHFAVPLIMPRADVLKLCDLPAPFPGVPNEYRPTILIDLNASEDALSKATMPQTRKMVRHAEREGITIERLPELTEETWNAFMAAHSKLWRRKHGAGALGIGQIGELVRRDNFAFTRSRDQNGNVLSWHTYVRTPERVRLHTTISDMDPSKGSQWNNTVGRAHRLHHWRDILQFKSEGVHIYDFGGVYRGTSDPEQINIARFKQLFGGSFADTYDAVVPLTFKGRLALSLISHVSAEARAGGHVIGVPA